MTSQLLVSFALFLFTPLLSADSHTHSSLVPPLLVSKNAPYLEHPVVPASNGSRMHRGGKSMREIPYLEGNKEIGGGGEEQLE
eukprot:1318617-Amorphochlora_amoeboformis.AAC.1